MAMNVVWVRQRDNFREALGHHDHGWEGKRLTILQINNNMNNFAMVYKILLFILNSQMKFGLIYIFTRSIFPFDFWVLWVML